MSHPVSTPRPRVALAGTSGFIGAALCGALAERFDLRILTRSMARVERGAEEELRPCDLFSRKELQAALTDVDVAIYLVHNREPSARLDQARTQDMDLLVADNFAWAAAQNGVKQILVRTPLVAHPARPSARDAQELMAVLASHGVPLTQLRTGLVVGPGGHLPRLLARLTRLPLVPLPTLADHPTFPLSLEVLLAAFVHCAGREATFGQAYDLYGDEAFTLRRLVEEAARCLDRHPRLVGWPGLPERGFAALVRSLCPAMHPVFLTYLLDHFAAGHAGQDNPVRQAALQGAEPFGQTLSRALSGQAGEPRRDRARNDEFLRQHRRVRSIQRLRLPAGQNAAWVAERYFPWMGELLRLMVTTERQPDGSWTVRQRPFRFPLLQLTFKPSHSTSSRRMYFITGGALAGALGGRTARLEFRDMLDGRFTLFAIHDFHPALPWVFYRSTQALIHALVMKGFQGYLEQYAEGAAPL